MIVSLILCRHKTKKENDLKRPANCSGRGKDTGRRKQVTWTSSVLGVIETVPPNFSTATHIQNCIAVKKAKSNQPVPSWTNSLCPIDKESVPPPVFSDSASTSLTSFLLLSSSWDNHFLTHSSMWAPKETWATEEGATFSQTPLKAWVLRM